MYLYIYCLRCFFLRLSHTTTKIVQLSKITASMTQQVSDMLEYLWSAWWKELNKLLFVSLSYNIICIASTCTNNYITKWKLLSGTLQLALATNIVFDRLKARVFIFKTTIGSNKLTEKNQKSKMRMPAGLEPGIFRLPLTYTDHFELFQPSTTIA